METNDRRIFVENKIFELGMHKCLCKSKRYEQKVKVIPYNESPVSV